jgi:3,4-dihydroxy 2-butanone 4-phosphate synthase/GTP cyclohydrolase II
MMDVENQSEINLNTIDEAILAIRRGEVIIVVDDEDRENEGDFICAAECITPEIINFMAMHGRGLICAPIDEQRADRLDLKPMVTDNTALHETAFTVSIDLKGDGVTTGISAHDRAKCIQALVDPESKPEQFARPGHIFPLRAKSGGVLRRTGHTEAAIDLAKLAGFQPVGVLVEILNDDGTMARMPQLLEIARRFELKIISIADLVAYRMQRERLIKLEKQATFPTKNGTFQVYAFSQITSGDVHLALVLGNWAPDEAIPVRVHSSTETGDLFGILFDNYGHQIKRSLEIIHAEEKGVLLFIRQSEKPDNVLHIMESLMLGDTDGWYKPEQRDFGVGAQILRDLGVTKLKLLSSHSRKRVGLIGYGLEVVEQIALD